LMNMAVPKGYDSQDVNSIMMLWSMFICCNAANKNDVALSDKIAIPPPMGGEFKSRALGADSLLNLEQIQMTNVQFSMLTRPCPP
jgi:hypothetical protein